MGSSEQGNGIIIYGGGALGLTLRDCLGRAPFVRQRAGPALLPYAPRFALVCWPAQAAEEFPPELAGGAEVTTFCNGAWVPAAVGAQGCAYVRAKPGGEHGPATWRVSDPELGAAMRDLGASVIVSHTDPRAHAWGKALYILPLALACEDAGEPAREVYGTAAFENYFGLVFAAAREELGWIAAGRLVPRARYLAQRSPRGWFPSPSADELAYFRRRLKIV